jgi:hypothetical protein
MIVIFVNQFLNKLVCTVIIDVISQKSKFGDKISNTECFVQEFI